MVRLLKALAVVGGVGLVVVLVYRVSGGSPPLEVHGGDRARPLSTAIAAFDPTEIDTILRRDAIPAIHDPEIVPGSDAELLEDEFVIGVELEGQARAYPIRVLSAHEIVNDEIAGQPIAVTW